MARYKVNYDSSTAYSLLSNIRGEKHLSLLNDAQKEGTHVLSSGQNIISYAANVLNSLDSIITSIQRERESLQSQIASAKSELNSIPGGSGEGVTAEEMRERQRRRADINSTIADLRNELNNLPSEEEARSIKNDLYQAKENFQNWLSAFRETAYEPSVRCYALAKESNGKIVKEIQKASDKIDEYFRVN